MLFEHSTPVFIIISHEMPKVFQNYILIPLFLYFCIHDIQVASQSAKNSNRYALNHIKIKKQMRLLKKIF